MVKKVKKFLRREWYKYSKLGRRHAKKQKWKKPTGRHNKMREGRKGCPACVNIGYGTQKDTRGKIMGKTPVIIMNINDLAKLNENDIAMIGGIGKKKKMEIAKIALEKRIEICNMNAKSFLKKHGKNKEAKKQK